MEKALIPKVPFKNCPIRTSLGVLGKKWTMLIMRDIGFLKVDRFNEMLRTLPGLTPRVLSMRLMELKKNGFIKEIEIQRTPRLVRWGLTRKGRDTLPILMSFIAFGAKWHSDIVFEDRQPRTPEELFPNRVKFAPVIKNV
ncbi:MAG TPA: helix-turn-helix domain-containing protein [Candidatus Bathyarchaeia archaeon]|nr:helix-turn-helix domain-containing protein [Candidatus Bathyarchaeia archaeon]